jgi:hypothetical protein
MDSFLQSLYHFLLLFFLCSSIPKLFNLSEFMQLVESYEVLTKGGSRTFGFFAPIFESIFAIMILVHATALYGLIGMLLMLITFFYAVSTVMKNKKVITCGCYGKFHDSKADIFTVIKIVFLKVVIIILLFYGVPKFYFSILAAVTGVFITITFLIAQKLWDSYQETVKQYRLK